MRKFFVFIVAVFLLFPFRVFAQISEEHIKKYDVNISIKKDGSIDIVENIDYFFSTTRHGIFRKIPIIKINADGKKYKLAIKDIAVVDGQGKNIEVNVSDQNDAKELKIGNKELTIVGDHRYIISYTVFGALAYFPGHDELYWNFVGDQWPVPIISANSTVIFPEVIAKENLNSECFVGETGSKNQNCLIEFTDNSVLIKTNQTLQAYEGTTVVVGFPKGLVAVLEPTELVPFFETNVGKVILILLVIFAVFWYVVLPFWVIRKWWQSGRDPKPAMGEVGAWFSPPKTKKLRNLTPAETGTIVDETADLRDIYATFIDLARRGYLKIIETKKGYFDLEKQIAPEKDSELQEFEEVLLSAVFKNNNHVSLKDLKLQETFIVVKNKIYESLVIDKFFPENPQKIRIKYDVLAVLALFSGNIILFIVALIFGKNMPKKTLFGVQASMEAKSLNKFLVSQDKQFAFMAEKQLMFEKMLAFAVAFGVEEIWANRFKDLNLKKPEWYVTSNHGAFNSVLFAQSIHRGASISFASSVTYRSSRGYHSGFSGGFSGGGGGGGGGGSW